MQGGDDFLCRALTDARQAAQKLRVFALDGVGNDMDGMHDRLHGLGRPHAVHRNETLKELLLDLMQEPDQQRLGLILRRMIGNVQFDGLRFPVSRSGQGPRHDRRKVNLITDAARLNHDHLVGAPEDRTPQIRDHSTTSWTRSRSGTPARDSAVRQMATASETCTSNGSGQRSRRCTAA